LSLLSNVAFGQSETRDVYDRRSFMVAILCVIT